jgi:signal peptidase I
LIYSFIRGGKKDKQEEEKEKLKDE